MSKELDEAIKKVSDLLRQESNPNCVSVNIFFNCEGYEIDYKLCGPGISRKNISGEWIE